MLILNAFYDALKNVALFQSQVNWCGCGFKLRQNGIISNYILFLPNIALTETTKIEALLRIALAS